MNAIATVAAAVAEQPLNRIPIGMHFDAPVELDLDRLLAGRLLIQGSSGAGKSLTLRKVVEEAFEYATMMIVDPEGDFTNLAEHIGATTIRAASLSLEGLTAAAARGREHRIALHIDLSDLDPDDRITRAAAFFAGLVGVPRNLWLNTAIVAIDEAHLLAPHVAGSARDAEVRKLGVSTLTDLCSRGRKRGLAPVIATQRLAKLATSVVSELQNFLIGLNVLDRDVARAADILGFTAGDSDRLRALRPGEFFAMGPALSTRPKIVRIDQAITEHFGSTPELLESSGIAGDNAAELLDLAGLLEMEPSRHQAVAGSRGGARALDAFLIDPAAPVAAQVIAALRKISPNATTADDLARHLGTDRAEIDDALDMLSGLTAVDTMPRGDGRIARLAARLRQRATDMPVVGLS